MQFNLPENLREKVAIYDPALKPLIIAQQAEAASSKKRDTYSLGLPNNLLPNDLCTEIEQIELSKAINKMPATERAVFAEVEGKGCYIIIWHRSVWVACWFFNKDYKNAGYVYGASMAFKNTDHTWSKVPTIDFGKKASKFNPINGESITCKYGRTEFVYAVKLVTKSDIINDYPCLPFDAYINRWGQSVSVKNGTIRSFTRKLTKQIPHWKDEALFTRIKDEANPIKIIANETGNYWSGEELTQDFTAENILNFLKKKLSINNEMSAVLETPYFKKELAQAIKKTKDKLYDPNTQKRRDVAVSFTRFIHQLKNLQTFSQIYPNAALDHYQQAFELGAYHEKLYLPSYRHTQETNPGLPGTGRNSTEWIRNSVPVTSYLKIIRNKYEEKKAEWEAKKATPVSIYGPDLEFATFRLRELDDTITMLQTCIDDQMSKGKGYAEVPCPTRWRISDWHDHVSALCFKIRNPNENFRQDLLPTPISVNSNGQKWTYFQPIDLHQLALWGRAVRNCVGNASSYKEGIKKKTHFIVLAMIDNKPHITIQLKVNNGVLTVDQIADVANKRLTPEQQEQFKQTFSDALAQAESAIPKEAQ